MIKLASAILLASCAMAQDPGFPLRFDWDKLSAKATEKVNVNLTGPMLQMAAQFLSGADKDQVQVKKLVEGLKGISVRSLEFDKEGAYSESDVSAIRAQMRSPEWSQMADVQGKEENAAIYVKTDGKQFQGLVVLSAEPRELTVVQILGVIDPAMLGALGGNFGIPKMNLSPKPKAIPAPKKK